jgi:hypothetical protein
MGQDHYLGKVWHEDLEKQNNISPSKLDIFAFTSLFCAFSKKIAGKIKKYANVHIVPCFDFACKLNVILI